MKLVKFLSYIKQVSVNKLMPYTYLGHKETLQILNGSIKWLLNKYPSVMTTQLFRNYSFCHSGELFHYRLNAWSLGIAQARSYSIRRKDYTFPEIKAEDLEETFVRGSGPGGQSVNQTSNCVVLKHKPSGIVIKCHDTRSLEENRKRAKIRLEEKLDLHLNGENSYMSQIEKEDRQSRLEKKSRAHKKLALKRAFKERENFD